MTEKEKLFFCSYIRQLLEERKLTLSNIQKMRRIVTETDEEIIEAYCTPATCYDSDKVQSNGDKDRVVDILDRLHIEKRQQRYDKTKLNALLDEKESEIEWLDYHVIGLPAVLHCTIVARFYDGLTNAETEKNLFLGKNVAHRNVKKAVLILASEYYAQFCAPKA